MRRMAGHDAAEPRRHHGDEVVAGEVGARSASPRPRRRPGGARRRAERSGSSQRRRRSSPTSSCAEKTTHRGSGRPSLSTVTRSVEEDRDLLPVRLVLVDPGEPGPPVVEGVEEPVLADDPVAVAHDAGVVRGMARVEVVVLQGQRGDGAAAGHRTAEQQGHAAEGVDGAAGQPDLRQAMPGAELRTLGAEPAADALPAGRRDGDAAEGVPGAAELEPPARQLVEVELARLRDQARLVVRRSAPTGCSGARTAPRRRAGSTRPA